MSFALGFLLGLGLGVVGAGVWVSASDLLRFYREGK